jgi:predicted ATP-dependent endonuclease of OLD family
MTIQSVKITNLYGNDYEWQLNPDVNILIGANGTYKSTILALIKEANKEDDLYLFGETKLLIVKEGNLKFKYDEPKYEIHSKVLELLTKIIPNCNEDWFPSDGAKCLINILNTVCHISENQQLVLFLDNPENNLHIDWQRNLIKWIRELNPTCQIIMTTHSPTIYYSGWIDKVTRIKDIKTTPHSPTIWYQGWID